MLCNASPLNLKGYREGGDATIKSWIDVMEAERYDTDPMIGVHERHFTPANSNTNPRHVYQTWLRMMKAYFHCDVMEPYLTANNTFARA